MTTAISSPITSMALSDVSTTPARFQNFGTNVSGAVDLDIGPDGSLYYISVFGNGFTGTNRRSTGSLTLLTRIARPRRLPPRRRRPAARFRSPSASAAVVRPIRTTTPCNTPGDFGDGTTGTGVTVSHQYTVGGTYYALLTVMDDQGGTNTSQPIKVSAGNQAPVGVIATPLSDAHLHRQPRRSLSPAPRAIRKMALSPART